jgi:hypothetical protein
LKVEGEKEARQGSSFFCIEEVMDGLEHDRESSMNIDACLGIVPTTAAAIHKAACLGASIIGVLGVEDIINLAQDTDIRGVSLLTPFLYRQLIL